MKILTSDSKLRRIIATTLPPLLLTVCFIVPTHDVSADEGSDLLFVRRIQPLLSQKCWACHGNDPDDIKGALNLKSLTAALAGGESGTPALASNAPEKSPLYLAVMREHDEWPAMPPKEADQLSAEQVGWIREWIAGGALWPDAERVRSITEANAKMWSEEDGVVVPTHGGLTNDWTHRRYKTDGLWAYQPLKKPDAASLQNDNSAKSIIDSLIALKLPPGIQPAPATDARTFIRRATFDLTGLPPTPDEISAFVTAFENEQDAAVASLIDRLLESPHYGERMAQHWLDVTRYADSSGFANDYERGNAWRYRDYVIRAFNSDKPYDQFVREQIAGDEIDANDPEKVIATGFLRMGPWELTGMEVARIARQRFLDDVTNSVGETFLAHSLQCARCHDHKFDPVPTNDYYSIQAVFATTQLAEREAAFLPGENLHGFEERVYLEKSRDAHLETLAELDKVLLENAQKWFSENSKDASEWNSVVDKIKNHSSPPRSAQVKSKAYSDVFQVTRAALQKQGISEDNLPPKLVGFTPGQFGRERVARKGLERLKWELERYEPFALAVYNGVTRHVTSVNSPTRMPANRMSEGELDEMCIRFGGDPFSAGPKVQPGTLSVLGTNERSVIPTSIEGRRLAFADWIVNPNNPLTTRSIVNRIWMWHFNQPIAGNPNNFGSTGKQPTHPELLDWLAATFIEQGWSFKALHRIIMTSDAYRRSAIHGNTKSLHEVDPSSTSYAVFKPRRLSAEELRDAMLAASGELNPATGGIPCRPEINLEAALQPRQVMGTFAAAWIPNPRPEQRNRRSIYALKLRGLIEPSMEVFNAPSPDFSCERRESSTVTPQVFAMFNSQAGYSRALALADRSMQGTATDTEAIHLCFELVYGRTAKADEVQACLDHWRNIEDTFGTSTFVQEPQPLEVLREAVEENTGEKFTFSEKLFANADHISDLQPVDVDAHTRALADVCLALFNSNEFVYVY